MTSSATGTSAAIAALLEEQSEEGTDKLAAYQTLYTVLLTLTKLLAPIMPFLTETMYQNLSAGPERKESVHLCDYPTVDETLIDETLSDDMDALLELVSLGSAARNTVKIKVRQPLAEMKVQTDNKLYRRAIGRFPDLIKEELNLKKVTLHEPTSGALLRLEAHGNPKTLGPKFGQRLAEVLQTLAAMPADELAKKVAQGTPFIVNCAGGPVELEPADVVMQWRAPEGHAGVAEQGTQVLIDTRITPELAAEGMAREVVRHVQELRKKAALNVEDRISLYLATGSAGLVKAIEVHRDYIARETLTTQWSTQPLDGQVHEADVKVDGQALHIELRKAG